MAFTPPDVETLIPYGLAIGLGLLIGIERERHRTEKVVLAGVRTYPLVSLSGLLSASLATMLALPLLISVGAFVLGGFALLMYWVRQAHGTRGLTSPIALYATYFIGVLVGVGRESEAIIVGLLVAILLFTKERLHHLVDVLTPQEIEGALYFLVIAFILYPVAPEAIGTRWGEVRVRAVVLIVLLVSLLSFLSFLAIRRWGSEFGLPFSGLLGGLVNSEAATASLADLHRKRPTLQHSIYLAVLLATGTMFLRNLVIAGIADPTLALVRLLLVPLLVPSLVLLAWGLVQLRKAPARGKAAALKLTSPFAFRPAFIFAFWFGVVSFATVALIQPSGLGDQGIYLAALGGLVSAGAVTASMGALITADLAPLHAAATTAAIASLLSATNKALIAWIPARSLANRLWAPTFTAAGAGAIVLLGLL